MHENEDNVLSARTAIHSTHNCIGSIGSATPAHTIGYVVQFRDAAVQCSGCTCRVASTHARTLVHNYRRCAHGGRVHCNR